MKMDGSIEQIQCMPLRKLTCAAMVRTETKCWSIVVVSEPLSGPKSRMRLSLPAVMMELIIKVRKGIRSCRV